MEKCPSKWSTLSPPVPRCFALADNLDAVILLTTCNLLTTDQKLIEGHDQVLITPHFIAVFRKLPPAKTGERDEAAAASTNVSRRIEISC